MHFSSDTWSPEFTAEAALQSADPAMTAKFDAWNARTVDLPGRYFLQTTEWIFRENRLANGCFPALGREVGLAAIATPIFVLAAADDEVVSPPQATAVRLRCRKAKVAVRVEPGRHLSLFMGRRTLRTAWPDIARWLGEQSAIAANGAAACGRMDNFIRARHRIEAAHTMSARHPQRPPGGRTFDARPFL